MNTPLVIFTLFSLFSLGYIVGLSRDKKDVFDLGAETGKTIAGWDGETTEIKTESNYLDLVRDYFPNISDEEADHILWTKTPFPMRMDEKEIAIYLAEYKKEVAE